MIYLCKPCELLSVACGESCKFCRATCGESCKACGRCWDALFDIFGSVTRFPLGGYVMGTWVTMIVVLVCSVLSFLEVQDLAAGGALSQGCLDTEMICLGNSAFAVLHFIAARYIQWRIVSKVKETMEERTPGVEIQGNNDIPHDMIAESAYEVALYDVGFCLYFFIFAGSFGFNCWGWTLDGKCLDNNMGWGAAFAMILYGIGVWNYFFCWYCMQYCCGKAKKKPKGGAGPGAQQVGGQP